MELGNAWNDSIEKKTKKEERKNSSKNLFNQKDIFRYLARNPILTVPREIIPR